MTQNKGVQGFAALALTAMLAATGHAFSSKQIVTKSATASLTGAGTVTMAVSVKNLNGSAAAGDIVWNAVTLPVAGGFKLADTYLQVDSQLTQAGSGIQIYTDNMGSGATPKFGGDPAKVDPSGLIDNSTNTLRLPIAWSAKNVNDAQPIATNPNNNPNTDTNAPQWLFMKDAATKTLNNGSGTTVFTPGEDFVTVVSADKGGHFTQDQFFPGTFPTLKVYVSADFGAAVTPRQYSTNKLTVESFLQ